MKKIFLGIIFCLIICSVFLPVLKDNIAFAETCQTTDGAEHTCDKGERIQACCPDPKKDGGLMVCGNPCCRCEICDFFRLIETILDFLMFRIAPVAGVLLIIIGGVMFLISSGNPATVTKAKSIIISVILGLTIMYTAYMVIGFVLTQIGLSDWAENTFRSWISGEGSFVIQCGGKAADENSSGDITDNNSAITSYCNNLRDNQPDRLKNCTLVYGGKGTNQYFDYCVSNPCKANLPNGCQVWDSGGGGGYLKDHCYNK